MNTNEHSKVQVDNGEGVFMALTHRGRRRKDVVAVSLPSDDIGQGRRASSA